MQFWYKIKLIWIVSLITAIHSYTFTFAQLKTVNKSGTYRQLATADTLKKMIELRNFIPGLGYDLRYATKNNFTRQRLYQKVNETFLRLAPATALKQVQIELNQKGLGLKVFDAYRPYSVTQKMWKLIRDERYVADPSKGSNHNRGLAVDLTIISLRDGSELNMGTGFDNFTDTAHHSFKDLPLQVLQNRALLKKTMEKSGFKALETEWWHYTWPNDRNYEVLNLDFRKFKHH